MSTNIYSGFQRATSLYVEVYRNNVLESRILLYFNSAFTYNNIPYPLITNEQIALLDYALYAERVNAYVAYSKLLYQSRYPGIEFLNTGSIIYNTGVCPRYL